MSVNVRHFLPELQHFAHSCTHALCFMTYVSVEASACACITFCTAAPGVYVNLHWL